MRPTRVRSSSCSQQQLSGRGGARAFSESRLAAALPDDPRVTTSIRPTPYRSVAAKVWRSLRPRYPDPPPRENVHVHEPLTIRRDDPVDARQTTDLMRERERAATRLGLERPAVITANLDRSFTVPE